MKSFASIMGTVLVASGCAAASADQSVRFTDSEIRQDIARYVETVFGSGAATLANYNGFEGPKDEAEYALELRECSKRWGAAFQAGEKTLTRECASWVAERARRAATADSLYYAELRSRVTVRPGTFSIVSVSCDAGTDNACVIKASAEPVGELEFYHAASRRMADLGLMGLTSVNGEPIAKILEEGSAPAAH